MLLAQPPEAAFALPGASLIPDPCPQLQPFFGHIVKRNVKIPVSPVVFHAGPIIPFPKIIRHIPDHAHLVESFYALCRQVSGLDVVLPIGAQIGEPAAKFDAIGADVICLDVQIPVFFPV